MALSSYDTLAVNAKGEPTNGVFTSKKGVTVAFYKNWLYVRDEAAWAEGGPFVKPTIMEVYAADFTYKDIKIVAKRGPQQGVYAVVYSQSWARVPEEGCALCGRKEKWKPIGKEPELPFHVSDCPAVFDCMVGIGCYGYSDDGEFIGVAKESVAFLKAWLSEREPVSIKMNATDGEPPRHEFINYTFEEAFRKIPLDNPLRFNQGDAYFAKHVGFETPATEPGSAEPTILSSVLK